MKKFYEFGEKKMDTVLGPYALGCKLVDYVMFGPYAPTCELVDYVINTNKMKQKLSHGINLAFKQLS